MRTAIAAGVLALTFATAVMFRDEGWSAQMRPALVDMLCHPESARLADVFADELSVRGTLYARKERGDGQAAEPFVFDRRSGSLYVQTFSPIRCDGPAKAYRAARYEVEESLRPYGLNAPYDGE